MDGTFWSLYVEVGFYFVFGLAFFWRGWKAATIAILSLYTIAIVGRLLTHTGSTAWRISSAMSDEATVDIQRGR